MNSRIIVLFVACLTIFFMTSVDSKEDAESIKIEQSIVIVASDHERWGQMGWKILNSLEKNRSVTVVGRNNCAVLIYKNSAWDYTPVMVDLDEDGEIEIICSIISIVQDIPNSPVLLASFDGKMETFFGKKPLFSNIKDEPEDGNPRVLIGVIRFKDSISASSAFEALDLFVRSMPNDCTLVVDLPGAVP